MTAAAARGARGSPRARPDGDVAALAALVAAAHRPGAGAVPARARAACRRRPGRPARRGRACRRGRPRSTTRRRAPLGAEARGLLAAGRGSTCWRSSRRARPRLFAAEARGAGWDLSRATARLAQRRRRCRPRRARAGGASDRRRRRPGGHAGGAGRDAAGASGLRSARAIGLLRQNAWPSIAFAPHTGAGTRTDAEKQDPMRRTETSQRRKPLRGEGETAPSRTAGDLRRPSRCRSRARNRSLRRDTGPAEVVEPVTVRPTPSRAEPRAGPSRSASPMRAGRGAAHEEHHEEEAGPSFAAAALTGLVLLLGGRGARDLGRAEARADAALGPRSRSPTG